MKKIMLGIFGALIPFLLVMSQPVSGCTDFRLTAKDNTVLISRSMEFAIDFKSNLRSSPREREFTNTTPDNKTALSWKSKYGYLYLDGLNVDTAIDGMNEEGLSFEALYLPNETMYQTIPTGKENQALPYYELGDWVLSNFKTVDEVKQALSNIYVYARSLPETNNMSLPMHAAIYDATGKGIVVEFVNGKMNIFDNKLGVMTNSPTYDWQLTNLRNYLNLSPTNPNPVQVNGMTFVSTGQGSGMFGLPGDISPPSRFVKISTLLKTVLPANDSQSIVNLAQHIMNTVDIPLGFVREPQDNNKYTNETTQWVVFKDLTNKLFYYRTYENLALHLVDLKKVDFSKGAAPLKMPIASQQIVVPVTDQFVASK